MIDDLRYLRFVDFASFGTALVHFQEPMQSRYLRFVDFASFGTALVLGNVAVFFIGRGSRLSLVLAMKGVRHKRATGTTERTHRRIL